MPVYQLPEKLIFPNPEEAEPEGLLAVGGDLSTERLLLAYSQGIFPWYSDEDPILWWSPDPRLILKPECLRVSKSLKRIISKKQFSITMDHDFKTVINNCAKTKRKEDGTWIVNDMINAYIKLHHKGFAHSVEVWEKEKLMGGLYGVSIGKIFFGESMFSKTNNASKIALVYLVKTLSEWGFSCIDCQVKTEHLISMGACEISRHEFLNQLKKTIKEKTRVGKWSLPENLAFLPAEKQRLQELP
jgi:leucyl/phenylalanyl-tRNA--protein transferase